MTSFDNGGGAILDKADKALQKVSQLLTERETQLWQNRLEQVRQMPGASLKFRRIANAPDREQLYDYLAEIRYALVFAGIGFHPWVIFSDKKILTGVTRFLEFLKDQDNIRSETAHFYSKLLAN